MHNVTATVYVCFRNFLWGIHPRWNLNERSLNLTDFLYEENGQKFLRMHWQDFKTDHKNWLGYEFKCKLSLLKKKLTVQINVQTRPYVLVARL